jgi:tetratricopeptide (TPR) repeat protein
MGYLGRWLPTTIRVVAIVMVAQQSALAKTAQEVNQIAQAITVKVSYTKRESWGEDNSSNGSGILLQQVGDVYTVLTAAHVVRGKMHEIITPDTITTPDGQQYKIIANSVRVYRGNVDLAVVKFRSYNNYRLAELDNSNITEKGAELYVAGFPVPTEVITKSVFVFREGRAIANGKRPSRDSYTLAYNNNTLLGMNGGPVLSNTGKVVGIHGDQGNQVKLGLNIGIPIARLADVASELGVDLGAAAASMTQNPLLNKDPHRTLADLNLAINLQPDFAEGYFLRGLLKYEKLNDPQSALVDFNKVLALRPNLAEAYAFRGALKYEKLNDSQSALVDFNKAIALQPNLAVAYLLRSSLRFTKLNNPQGALADSDKAIALPPDNAIAYNNRGIMRYQRLNDLQGALADYNRAIALKPDYLDAYYGRGSFFYMTGRKAEAIQDFRKARAINATSWGGLMAEGIIALEHGSTDLAITAFSRALHEKPQSDDVFKYRGLAYRRQGSFTLAIQNWQKAAPLYKATNQTRDYQSVRGWLKELGARELP